MNVGMLSNGTEAVNRCLEAICERWLINGGKMKWEMKRCLLRLMKRELVGGLFIFQAQSSVQMKGGNSNIEAYCGFIPLMSSANRNPLWHFHICFHTYLPYTSFLHINRRKLDASICWHGRNKLMHVSTAGVKLRVVKSTWWFWVLTGPFLTQSLLVMGHMKRQFSATRAQPYKWEPVTGKDMH